MSRARGELLVATMGGLVRIPLTGDQKFDASLERLARRGGTSVRREGESSLPCAQLGLGWSQANERPPIE